MIDITTLDFWTGLAAGVIIGAVGQYLGDRATDSRRRREQRREVRSRFDTAAGRMPELIEVMRKDLREMPLVREFILIERRAIYGGAPNHPLFRYDFEDYDHLEPVVRNLVSLGFVQEITFNNTLRFRMSEEFADSLAGS
ncbi:MAG: hypothetical protein CHACPFDD_01979 [Phycisphaerae bacterium]|nr:hypothetical protein [Phycisphaerae bacterium]